MKKLFFSMLAACFVLTSLNVANAALPFTPSTNTTDGAVWYRMFNATAAANGLSSYLKAADYGEQLVMADAAASDDFLFCLVGDETAGFQIYNKALLDDGTKLTSVFLNWFNPIIATTAANAADWDAGGYTWTFDTDGSLMAMYSGTRYFFRFPSDMKQVLTCTYGGGDAIWTFEPSDTPIQTDFSGLESYLTIFTATLNADKLNNTLYPKYKAGMDVFEAVVASAQAVADTKDTQDEATQAEVNAALDKLRKANSNYRLAKIDLPVNVSTSETTYWYAVYGNGLNDQQASCGGSEGSTYWTYNEGSGKFEVGDFIDDDDSQLWSFTGDNVTGINIYNKAAGNSIMLIGDFSLAGSWDGMWKMDKTGDEYGLVNVNGALKTDFEFNEYFHLQYCTNLMYYGISDAGSRWTFVQISPTSIGDVASDEVSVFSRDGMVYLQGTDAKATIASLTGQTAVFDAQSPYAPGATGIYIVKVNGKAYKVAVK